MATINELEELQQTEKIFDESSSGFESETFRFGKLILEDDTRFVPEDMMEKFWITFDKEMALSNFEKDDINWMMLNLDIAKIDLMLNSYESEIDFDKIRNFDLMRMKMLAKIKRSTGNMTRERALFAQQHQIKQLIMNEPDQPKGGILGRIFGGRG